MIQGKKDNLFLAKAAIDQPFESVKRGGGIVAVGLNFQACAFGGGKHHHVHDAFAIHALIGFPNANGAVELVGDIHKLHRGPGMKAELIGYFNFSFHVGLCRFQSSGCVMKLRNVVRFRMGGDFAVR